MADSIERAGLMGLLDTIGNEVRSGRARGLVTIADHGHGAGIGIRAVGLDKERAAMALVNDLRGDTSLAPALLPLVEAVAQVLGGMALGVVVATRTPRGWTVRRAGMTEGVTVEDLTQTEKQRA
jgi:hypothetical protein